MTDWLLKQILKLLISPFFKRAVGVTETEDALKQGKYPILHAIASLILFLGGAGQSYLGQEDKAVLIMIVEAIVGVISIILILLFPFIYFPFKLLCAFDAYQMAKRVKSGRQIGRWEFFWNSPGGN